MSDLLSTITIPEVLRRYPVSSTTIRRAIREGRLPAERILNKYRIFPEDVEKFLRSGSLAAAEEK